MSTRARGEEAISVGEAAQLTGASSKSLRRRIERGTLGSIRQGARRLVPVSELIRVGLLDGDRGTAAGAARPAPWDASAPGRAPASAPTLRAPWSTPAPRPGAGAASDPGRGGLSEKDGRRLGAMVELVMHQTRTIAALQARVARLEALHPDAPAPPTPD